MAEPVAQQGSWWLIVQTVGLIEIKGCALCCFCLFVCLFFVNFGGAEGWGQSLRSNESLTDMIIVSYSPPLLQASTWQPQRSFCIKGRV